MKKILCLLLVLVMAFGMVACGGETADPTTPPTDNPETGKPDPTADDTINILMIGNSFCYYFPDELYAMATAAGKKVVVCNVYYSGCKIYAHYSWLGRDEEKYQFFTRDASGTQKAENVSLNFCLAQRNWDVISLQQHYDPKDADDEFAVTVNVEPYLQKLYEHLRNVSHEKTRLMWHQTWAYQVGYTGSLGENPSEVNPSSKVLTVEKQTANYESIRFHAISICEKYKVERIPSGDAWQIARANPVIGDTLCNKGDTDYYHDGDIGGGQYLNACVWYEVVFGESCVGNTFRPDYALSEEKIQALQQAAHEAVANRNQ